MRSSHRLMNEAIARLKRERDYPTFCGQCGAWLRPQDLWSVWCYPDWVNGLCDECMDIHDFQAFTYHACPCHVSDARKERLRKKFA